MKTSPVLAVVWCLTVFPVMFAQTSDLRSDWSTTNNPNEVWTYMAAGNILVPSTVGVLQTNFSGWTAGSDVEPPALWQHPEDWPEVDVRAGDIIVHASNTTGSTVDIVWTASLAGTYDVTGSAWYAMAGLQRGSSWSVFLNSNLLTSGEIAFDSPYSRAAPFEFVAGSGGADALTGLSLNPGDEITLSIDKLSWSDYGSQTGLNFTITAVPEPAATAFLGGIAVALLALVRRTRGANWLMLRPADRI